MQTDYTRYAIYWVPAQGSRLADFGSGWTGWCADRGDIEHRPDIRRLAGSHAGVPGSVALHGLHANVKSPFSLAEPGTIWALRDDLLRLASSIAAIELPRFEVTVFDGQVVLALTRPNEAVVRLMGQVAEVVLPLQVQPRYGMPGQAGARGTGNAPLPAYRDWGSTEMPGIERFHMPLTDHLDLGVAYELVAALKPALDPILAEPQVLGDLALVADPGQGRPWRLIERYALAHRSADRASPVPTGMDCEGPRLITALNDLIGADHNTVIV